MIYITTASVDPAMCQLADRLRTELKGTPTAAVGEAVDSTSPADDEADGDEAVDGADEIASGKSAATMVMLSVEAYFSLALPLGS